MKDIKNKFLIWAKKHKKPLLIVSGVVFFALIGAITVFALASQKQPEPEPEEKPPVVKVEPKPVIYHSPLTGNVVANEEATKQIATAIMIENSPDARPHSGLKDSGVVFEAIAEGGITRFLVLYQEQKPALVGPVRSLRMYYLDWAAAFDASIAHIGGSASSLQEVRNGNYKDIDQFFNPVAYWRATDRYAPHNVYTNFEKIDALNQQKGFTTSSFTGFERKDSNKAETPTATSINVNISGPLYNSAYIYNAETNTYDRSQGGAPHLDREAGQISPRVVIVMNVTEQRVLEDGWREQINTVGEGDVTIFQDGTVVSGKWSKASRTEQVKFTDAEGKVIPLARGQTWLTALPTHNGSLTWQ